MDKKLTLSLDAQAIERAKEYATQAGTSLSKLVEQYFNHLAKPSLSEQKPRGLSVVDELTGVISLPTDFDEKAAYRQHLQDKYSN